MSFSLLPYMLIRIVLLVISFLIQVEYYSAVYILCDHCTSVVIWVVSLFGCLNNNEMYVNV